MFKIIIPCHGDQSDNFEKLIESIDTQSFKKYVQFYFAEDRVSPDFKKLLLSLGGNKNFIENKTKKRLYALKNICRVLDSFKEDDCIIGIIDGDDYLWGNNCIENIKNQYDSGFGCVWTANEWEGTSGLNHSGPLNDDSDVYSHPWVSSHFKTFLLSDYRSIPKKNFKNLEKKWFEACYDQALMLPIIHNVHKRGGKTKYINKVHYIYRGNIKHESEFRQKQLDYESFIRTRGYLK